MNKIQLMIKMGWTEKQYYEENTSEALAQIMFLLDKEAKVGEFERNRPRAKGNVNIKVG